MREINPPKRPLVRPVDEAAERARTAELERTANEIIDGKRQPGVVEALHQAATAALGAHEPLVPRHLVPVALALGALLLGASTVAPTFFPELPTWVPLTGAALALVSFYLGGQGAPSFTPAKPAVPLALVPILLTAATAFTTAASQTDDPRVHGGLLAAAALCSWLAGKQTPQPLKGH